MKHDYDSIFPFFIFNSVHVLHLSHDVYISALILVFKTYFSPEFSTRYLLSITKSLVCHSTFAPHFGQSFLISIILNIPIFYLSKASIPGKVPFARNSSIAPPPTLIQLKFFVRLNCLTTTRLSPPPTILNAFEFATALKTLSVPSL